MDTRDQGIVRRKIRLDPGRKRMNLEKKKEIKFTVSVIQGAIVQKNASEQIAVLRGEGEHSVDKLGGGLTTIITESASAAEAKNLRTKLLHYLERNSETLKYECPEQKRK